MDAWWVPLAVAMIGGPVMWLLHRLDRRNTEQHSQNMETLQRVDRRVAEMTETVDRLDRRMDDHIDWHLTRRDRSA